MVKIISISLEKLKKALKDEYNVELDIKTDRWDDVISTELSINHKKIRKDNRLEVYEIKHEHKLESHPLIPEYKYCIDDEDCDYSNYDELTDDQKRLVNIVKNFSMRFNTSKHYQENPSATRAYTMGGSCYSLVDDD